MAIVTSDFLAAALRGYRALFVNEFDAAQNVSDWSKIATKFQSNGIAEVYTWIGTVPRMQEWKDKRQVQQIKGEESYTLTNIHYEASIQVDKDTFQDDKLKMIEPRIRQLADEAARHPDELVFTQLDGGETLTAYDGTAFFANTRTIGNSSNIDNLLAATGQTEANIRTDIGLAYVAMNLFQDDKGRPMGLKPDTIVCSPELIMTIEAALLNLSGTEKRPESRLIKNIIVSPWIDGDATDWYLLCTNRPTKPIFVQERQKPEFTGVTNPEIAFMDNQYYYGVDYRGVVGYGDPRYAVKINAA